MKFEVIEGSTPPLLLRELLICSAHVSANIQIYTPPLKLYIFMMTQFRLFVSEYRSKAPLREVQGSASVTYLGLLYS